MTRLTPGELRALPDREVDVLVAKALGCHMIRDRRVRSMSCRCFGRGSMVGQPHNYDGRIRNYASDPTEMMTLLEHCRHDDENEMDVVLMSSHSGEWFADFSRELVIVDNPPTLPRAVAEAFVLAKQEAV